MFCACSKVDVDRRAGNSASREVKMRQGKDALADMYPAFQSQRCMIHIKSAHPAKFEAAYAALFDALWQESMNLAEQDLLLQVLQRVFSQTEAEAILQATKTVDVKGRLMKNTEHAWKDLGAYGAPWFWVGDGEGREEAFFGSDRWGYM